MSQNLPLKPSDKARGMDRGERNFDFLRLDSGRKLKLRKLKLNWVDSDKEESSQPLRESMDREGFLEIVLAPRFTRPLTALERAVIILVYGDTFMSGKRSAE